MYSFRHCFPHVFELHNKNATSTIPLIFLHFFSPNSTYFSSTRLYPSLSHESSLNTFCPSLTSCAALTLFSRCINSALSCSDSHKALILRTPYCCARYPSCFVTPFTAAGSPSAPLYRPACSQNGLSVFYLASTECAHRHAQAQTYNLNYTVESGTSVNTVSKDTLVHWSQVLNLKWR